MHANLAGSIPSTLGQEGPDTLLRVDAAARGCAISFLTSDSSASPDCFLSFFFGITTHDGTVSRKKAVHFRTVKVFFRPYSYITVQNWTDARPEHRYDRASDSMENMAAMSLVE